MRVQTLLFGSLASRVGQRALAVEVADGATVEQLLERLAGKHEAIASMRDRLAVAVNHEYVASDHVLSADDEVALIPPVSGG